jgi:hypothetical protein
MADMYVGTIHAFCLDLLMTEARDLWKFDVLWDGLTGRTDTLHPPPLLASPLFRSPITDHGGFKNGSEGNGAGLGEAASLKGAVKLGVFSLTRRLETRLLPGGGARAVVCLCGMLWG